YGPEVDLAAPGDVVSLLPNGRYGETKGGTSSAAAITSGVAALVRAQFPDLDAANVVNRLIATGRDIGAAGQDDKFGYGVVDPVAALTADVPPVSENPLGSPVDSGGTEPSEPPASEPGTSAPPVEVDPCASQPAPEAPGPAGSDGPAPAGALTLDEDCDEPGFVGVGPGASNDALGVVVAVGSGALLLIGGIVLIVRRNRARSAQPVPAYGAAVPPGAGAPGPGGWPPPPDPDPGGWQPPPSSGAPPGR
ncbi:MAG: S8 family serine peptidase, partial [Actinomycetes bacterium]